MTEVPNYFTPVEIDHNIGTADHYLIKATMEASPLTEPAHPGIQGPLSTAGHEPSEPFLPVSVWNTIKTLNINRKPSTHRGCRAGVKKQRGRLHIANQHHLGFFNGTEVIQPIPVIFRSRRNNSKLPLQINSKPNSKPNFNNLRTIKCVSNFNETTLDICLWNAWSVRNKTALLSDYTTENDIDVFFLTETWLYDDENVIIGELKPPGYLFLNHPRHDGRSGTRGGGIGVLYKTELNLMSISSGIVTTTFEHIVVTDQSRSILFIVIYRPPPSKVNKLKLSDYLVEIDNFIGETAQLPGKHIYLGDFNIHMNEPTKSHVAKFINILSCNNLQNYVTGPTHKSGNQLDLVIGNVDDNLVMNCKTHQNLMSDDHYSVFFKLNRKKPDIPRTYTSCRDFRTVDIDQLMMDLTTELAPLMSIMNVDEQVQFYDATVCDVLDRYCPIQSRKRTIRPRVPWYNDNIHLARRVKRRLERRWRKSKLDTDREAYVVQLGVLSELIHSAKASYFTDTLSSGNVKDTFKTINTLLNTTRNNLPVGESGKPLGDKFALSFKGKIVNIRNELDATSGIGDLTASGFHDVPVNCELSLFASADHDEISEIIVCAPNKTCSLDSMPTWLLKTYVHDMVQFVSHIVNTAISTGVFPDSLRRAIVTPILKKSNLDQNNLNNYMPVSNIPFLSKVIEKVVSRRLDSYIMENSLEQPF
ncbi:uncharacterized protein [Amphiura filiformis]|uniref:uncharacterized protein n=1 Tax=Amphiura filiformis TaxID=82378 RepID=UPI003B20F37F